MFLSWAKPIQFTSPHPTSPRSILILSTHLRLGFPSGLFDSGAVTYTRPDYNFIFQRDGKMNFTRGTLFGLCIECPSARIDVIWGLLVLLNKERQDRIYHINMSVPSNDIQTKWLTFMKLDTISMPTYGTSPACFCFTIIWTRNAILVAMWTAILEGLCSRIHVFLTFFSVCNVFSSAVEKLKN
jgi:hypothetical protein